MTEESFQQCRKVMQKANYLRGMITVAKGNVAKWTKIEDVHRREMRPEQADGAKKCLDKAMEQLDKARQKFEELSFPEHNIFVFKPKTVQCFMCGDLTQAGNLYCNQCMGM